jgi:hypothetical protein
MFFCQTVPQLTLGIGSRDILAYAPLMTHRTVLAALPRRPISNLEGVSHLPVMPLEEAIHT